MQRVVSFCVDALMPQENGAVLALQGPPCSNIISIFCDGRRAFSSPSASLTWMTLGLMFAHALGAAGKAVASWYTCLAQSWGVWLQEDQGAKASLCASWLTQRCCGLRQGKPHTLTVLPRTHQGPPQPHPHPHPLRSIGRENRGPLQPQHQAASHQQQQQEGERVMRTVYLPTANSDSLMLRIESLQAQLNEQVGFCGTLLESTVMGSEGAS